MSAEVVNAFEQEAHRLDAEADSANGPNAEVQREIAQVLRNLAQRAQGNDPAAVAAQQQVAQGQDSAASASGLAVDRTDAQGNPVQAPAQPDAQNSPGIA